MRIEPAARAPRVPDGLDGVVPGHAIWPVSARGKAST